MKLLVIVLCLLSERFLIHSMSYQRFFWFGDYYLQVKKIIDKSNFFANPWLTLIATILPLILLVSIIYLLFHNILFGFVGLILSIIIFFYCLGPQNAFYPLSETNEDNESNTVVGNYFAKVNSQLFSVIFWYIALGPIAVLTYRLITLCKHIDFISQQANQVTDILEWIPARITSLLYLLVGNFQKAFPSFIKLFFSSPQTNNQLLSVCGLQAIHSDESKEVMLLPVAENLVEHSTIVLLVFIALFTLVAWL